MEGTLDDFDLDMSGGGLSMLVKTDVETAFFREVCTSWNLLSLDDFELDTFGFGLMMLTRSTSR